MKRAERQQAAEALKREQVALAEELWRFTVNRWPRFAADAETHLGHNYFRMAGDEQLATAWALFHHRYRGRSALEEYLSTREAPLSPQRFAIVSAELAAWISYWEVVEVSARRGLRVVDLLTGEEATVFDHGGVASLLKGVVLCGRVLLTPEVGLFGGIFPTALPRTATVVKGLVGIANELYATGAGRIRPAALRAHSEPLALLNCWRMASGLLRPDHTAREARVSA